MAQMVKPSRKTQAASSSILASFIEATRRADSAPQVLGMVLTELCARFQCHWVMVFEKVSASEACFTCLAASPDTLPRVPIPATGYLLGRLRFHTLLPFGENEFDTVLRWASEEQPHHIPEVEYLKHLGARAAVPLWAKDEIVGLLLFGNPIERKQYSSSERDLMQACGQQLGLIMEYARLTERVVEQEKVRRNVALAAEVQKRFLPQSSIKNERSSAAGYFQPARVVSGDCYDLLDLEDEGIGIALADVAGKGVAAALVMAAIQSSIRIIASERRTSPADLVRKLNAFLYRSTGSNSYATFFYGNIHSGQLRYVNAGHNPPWLLRVSNSAGQAKPSYPCVEQLQAGGTVIGMFPEANYQEASVRLQSGDVVFEFTDGVTEALNPGQEEFGEERLQVLACRAAHLPVQEIVSCVSRELRERFGDAPQHDDLTLVIIKAN